MAKQIGDPSNGQASKTSGEGETPPGPRALGSEAQAEVYRSLRPTSSPDQPETEPQPEATITEFKTDLHSLETVEHQWEFFTAATLRAIRTNQPLREALTQYASRPVDQNLAAEMLREVAQADTQVAKLVDRFRGELGAFMALPEVSLVETDGDLNAALARSKITPVEHAFVADRFRDARDVKILALAAELTQQGAVSPDEAGEIDLPSGVRLMVDPADPELGRQLLDPMQWEKRSQLHDRVYEVTIGGSSYILKERKTGQHTSVTRDVLGPRHTDGLTSAEEYAVGKQFHEHGGASSGRIKLSWEKPLAYAEFPDGFQLVIFQHEEGLIGPENAGHVVGRLMRTIIDHRADFEQEYRQVLELSRRHWDHQDARKPWEKTSTSDSGPRAWVGHGRNRFKPITFEEYAAVKATRMVHQAEEMMITARREQRYLEPDYGGYAFRLPSPGQPDLEIIGLDYEYYIPYPDTPEAAKMAATPADTEYGKLLADVFDTRGEKAAYLSLVELERRQDRHNSSWHS
jgi:hypothetical protein